MAIGRSTLGKVGFVLGFKRYSFGGLWIAGLGFGVWGCGEDTEGAAPAPSAETVESRPGIVQVGAEKGPVLDEAEACEKFRSGLVRNLERLDCDAVPLLECPVLIQPLASLSCITYSKASVERCVANYDAADECTELLPGACVLTAVSSMLSAACGVVDAAVTNEPDAGSETGETSASVNPGAPDGSVTSSPSSVSDAGETVDAAGGTSDSGVVGNTSDSGVVGNTSESASSHAEPDAATSSPSGATSSAPASSSEADSSSATVDAGQ